MEKTSVTKIQDVRDEIWRSEAVCDECHTTLMTMTGTKMSLTAVKCPKDPHHSVTIHTSRVYP